MYADYGQISIEQMLVEHAVGIKVIAKDSGWGIEDVAKVMKDGYSTSSGLGFGLPGVRKLMDEFKIESRVGKGTEVTVIKWREE
ncbi:Serine/threonine-protein kinase RsbT [Bacillus sp. CECT 9360]|nr:Serine/threonine-protein kinase RsbT [Bacillus sp. CECT 9360]